MIFFGLLSGFAASIEHAYVTNEKRREAAIKEAKKAANPLVKAKSVKPHPEEVAGSTNAKGEFDRLLANMKGTGEAFSRKGTVGAVSKV